jgi:multiple sugar transport system substrate-binding protein
MTKEELLNLIELLGQIRGPAELRRLIEPDPTWNMTVYLLQRHLKGMLVTPTSLARAAGVPYTTAVRRIDALLREGLIIRRPRSSSGRLYSILPSRELLARTLDYAQQAKAALAKALGATSVPFSFYLGASYLSARIIPCPTPLLGGLGRSRALTVLLYDEPSFFVSESLQRELMRLMGGDVHFVGLPLDELRLSILSSSAAKRPEADVVAIDLPWIGEFASKRALLPLDDLIAMSVINRADFHPAHWEAAHLAGHQYGIPFQTNSELLFCRRDILEAHGLGPPTSTEALLAAAARMHAPRERMYGIGWTAAPGTPVGHAFMMFMADFGQPILNLPRLGDGYDAMNTTGTQLHAMVDTPRGRVAAEFMRELLPFSPPGILSISWTEQIRLFGRGHVAMTYAWSGRAAHFEFDPASPARGNTRYLPHPTGAPYTGRSRRNNVSTLGGFVLGIPANLPRERIQPVWRAIEWLTSPEVMKLFVRGGTMATPRFSVAGDPQVRALSPMIEAVDTMAKIGQFRLWPRPPVPQFSDIAANLGAEIHAMLSGEQSVRAALRNAQHRIDRLLRATPS